MAAGERLATAEPILDAVNAAIGQHRLLDIEYWSEGSGTTTSRTVEPYLLVRTRGEWYYVAWCRRSQGTRTFRLATTKRALLRDERFAPRADVEIELYRREGVRSSERYAPRRAAVWYAAAVARWAAEREPTLALPDGECLALLPYLDERWLIHEMLRFGGEALPLDPPAAAAALRRSSRGSSNGTLSRCTCPVTVVKRCSPCSSRSACTWATARPAAPGAALGRLARLRVSRGHRLPAAGRARHARALLRLPAAAPAPSRAPATARPGAGRPARRRPAGDLFSGRRRLAVEGGLQLRGALRPARPLADLPAAVAAALDAPLERAAALCPRRGARSVAVVVPDASRGCPVAALLPPVLERLAAAGVATSRSASWWAAACTARPRPPRRRPSSGAAVAARLRVVDAQGLSQTQRAARRHAPAAARSS